jgi:hypothetical protein
MNAVWFAMCVDCSQRPPPCSSLRALEWRKASPSDAESELRTFNDFVIGQSASRNGRPNGGSSDFQYLTRSCFPCSVRAEIETRSPKAGAVDFELAAMAAPWLQST